MKKTASKKHRSFLKYIGMAVGVVLLSGWIPKTAAAEISHKTEIQKQNVIEITGVVTSEYVGPLPGVAILIVGTNQGTSTNLEGRYTLTAKKGDEVQFVFEGFETVTITVFESGILNVFMVEDEEIPDLIGEVYRAMVKDICPGNNIVDSKTLEEYAEEPNATSPKSVLQVLSCQPPLLPIVSGDEYEPPFIFYFPEVNRSPEVLLKDVEALTRNMELTYIVDGIPVSEETFRSLNQNDIESIDIHRHTDMYNARFGDKENLNKRTLRNR